MKTVSQVTNLTGVSARTLQYYDEVGLLKPSELTSAGYRLYNDEALQKLQHILFFKELGFKLQEINQFISQPDFDEIAAYKKQKELLLLKRNRIEQLIQLLNRLEKGEKVMSFKEFDLSAYISALESFKLKSTDVIVKYWGSVENFDEFISKIKEDESQVAKLAIQQFGSVEKYTESMIYNMEHFCEIMDQQMTNDVKEIANQSDALYEALTSNMLRKPCSDEIQNIVQEMDVFMRKYVSVDLESHGYWKAIIDTYSSDYVKTITDTKYGDGASDYIIAAFQYYSNTLVKQ